MTFHTKLLLWAQYHCALGSMKQMNFFKMFDGIRYLALFSYSYDEICNRIKYLISEKSGITDSINQKSELIHIIIYLL